MSQRNHKITIRLTTTEYTLLTQLAHTQEKPLATTIHHIVTAYLQELDDTLGSRRRAVQSTLSEVARVAELSDEYVLGNLLEELHRWGTLLAYLISDLGVGMFAPNRLRVPRVPEPDTRTDAEKIRDAQDYLLSQIIAGEVTAITQAEELGTELRTTYRATRIAQQEIANGQV